MGKLNYKKDKHLDLLSKMDKDGESKDSEDLTLKISKRNNKINLASPVSQLGFRGSLKRG